MNIRFSILSGLLAGTWMFSGFLPACTPYVPLEMNTYVCNVDADCPSYDQPYCINYFSYFFATRDATETWQYQYPMARPIPFGYWGICSASRIGEVKFELCENKKDDDDDDESLVDCNDPACMTYSKCRSNPPNLYPGSEDGPCDERMGVKLNGYCFPRCAWSYVSDEKRFINDADAYCNTVAVPFFDFHRLGIPENEKTFKCVYVGGVGEYWHHQACLPTKMHPAEVACMGGKIIEFPYSEAVDALEISPTDSPDPDGPKKFEILGTPSLDATAVYCVLSQ